MAKIKFHSFWLFVKAVLFAVILVVGFYLASHYVHTKVPIHLSALDLVAWAAVSSLGLQVVVGFTLLKAVAHVHANLVGRIAELETLVLEDKINVLDEG